MSASRRPQLEGGTRPDLDSVATVPVADWMTLLSPETWLGHSTPEEFLGVGAIDLFSVVSEQEIRAVLAGRGVPGTGSDELVHCLIGADVACIAHALSALLSMSTDETRQLIPERIQDVIGTQQILFDHIGIEVFGKLEWYIELFDRAYAPLGINVVREHIFPSVQVKRALEYDENLGDVRIGRVFFSHGDTEVNLEVFEATQSWKYIALRQASLYAHLEEPGHRTDLYNRLVGLSGTCLEPVGHVAYRVSCAEVVESIQAVLLHESARSMPTMRPYVQQVFFNPSDKSTNTKFVVATELASGISLDSQIVEIISYED